MIHKNTFLFALVLINLFFLIYIVSNDSQESNVIYSSNIDTEKINKLESSFKEIYSILEYENNDELKGIFHCFSGTYEEAKKIIDMGFYLGIGGVLTFKNSTLDKVIKKIDLNHIVLETDAPYLSPHPMRGKRNEPKFLPLIAKRLAEIKEVNIEEIGKKTEKNINHIFFKKTKTITNSI